MLINLGEQTVCEDLSTEDCEDDPQRMNELCKVLNEYLHPHEVQAFLAEMNETPYNRSITFSRVPNLHLDLETVAQVVEST